MTIDLFFKGSITFQDNLIVKYIIQINQSRQSEKHCRDPYTLVNSFIITVHSFFVCKIMLYENSEADFFETSRIYSRLRF